MLSKQVDLQEILLQMVKSEVKPAIGCTEPIAVAYAAAAAKNYTKGKIEKVSVKTSLSIYKNGKSVIIPGTSEYGLDLAASLGITAGDAESGLCVLKNVDKQTITEAKLMISKGKVSVEPKHDGEKIFIEVNVISDNNVRVVISRYHTHIESIEVDGRCIYNDLKSRSEEASEEVIKSLTFKEIREIAEEIKFDRISFVLDGIDMNMKAAEEGLKKTSGLNMGAGLLNLQRHNMISNDTSMMARILTAAGADFRMGGGNLPIMTSGGSGNQGLGIILPIAVVGNSGGYSKDKIARALFFAHCVNIFIKSYVGKLSSLCGCAIAAGVGASAGITWMLGGSDEQIAGAAQNILANLTGMICDGAKESCALKLSTSAGEAVISSYLAFSNIIVPKKIGIVSGKVEDTIVNVEKLCKSGLNKTDEVIVDMLEFAK